MTMWGGNDDGNQFAGMEEPCLLDEPENVWKKHSKNEPKPLDVRRALYGAVETIKLIIGNPTRKVSSALIVYRQLCIISRHTRGRPELLSILSIEDRASITIARYMVAGLFN